MPIQVQISVASFFAISTRERLKLSRTMFCFAPRIELKANRLSNWKTGFCIIFQKRQPHAFTKMQSRFAIPFDLRMLGVVLGKHTSTMQETEHLQEQPKQVHCSVFLWFEPDWTTL